MIKILRYSFTLIFSVFLLTSLCIFSVLSTTTGATVLLYAVNAFTPVAIYFEKISGNLLDKLVVEELEVILPEQHALITPLLTLTVDYSDNNFIVELQSTKIFPEIALAEAVLSVAEDYPAQPDWMLNQVHIVWEGWPEDYTLNGTWKLNADGLPETQWQAQTTGTVSELNFESLTILLLNSQLDITGNLAWSPELRWNLAGKTTHLRPDLYWSLPNSDLDAEFTSSGTYTEDINAQIYLTLSGLIGNNKLNSTTQFDWQNNHLFPSTIHVDLGKNQLDISGQIKDNVNIQWQLNVSDLSALSTLWQGTLQSAGKVQGDITQPFIQGEINAKNIKSDSLRIQGITSQWQVDLQKEKSLNLDLTLNKSTYQGIIVPIAKLMVKGKTNKNDLAINADINLDKNNYLHTEWRLKAFEEWLAMPLAQQKFLGKINAKISQIELLALFSTAVNAEKGRLTANATLQGSISNPQTHAHVLFDGGEIYLPALNINLYKAEFNVQQNADKQIQYKGLLNTKQGRINIDGQSNLASSPPKTEFHITGENFLSYNDPSAQIYTTPDLYLNIVFPNITLTGDLLIPRATITAVELSDYIAPSTDVVIVRSTTPQEISSLWQFSAKINLKLGDPITFSGYGLNTQITGELALQQQQNITTANGELQLIKGKYNIYGQTLDISRGRLIYTGGVISNPTIDVEAQRKIRALKTGGATTQALVDTTHASQSVVDGVVGVQVQGHLENPKVTLFSKPGMSANDQLSYLIAGVPNSQLSSAQGQLLAKAALSFLREDPTEAATSKLGSTFGLDEVNVKSTTDIDPSTGNTLSNTSLVLGKALSPKLFVSYSVGLLDPVNILQLQYKLNEHWLLQTSSSTNGNSAGDVLYYWDRD